MMLSLLRTELYKIFHRPRTYISFLIIGAIALLIELAMYVDGKTFITFLTQSLNSSFSIEGTVLNGYLVTYIILGLLLVHVPLLVALVAADALAGEAGNGTLRLLLTKPFSRAKLVLAKFIASVLYSWLMLVWLAVIGLFLSLLIFGTGDMFNFTSNEIFLLMRDDIFWRYGCAFAYAALAMTTVCSLSLFLSVFAENAIGPIIGTMGIIIFLTIISNLNLPLFNHVKPWLFTTHMLGWKGFFKTDPPYQAIGRSALVLAGNIIFFVGATIFIFKRKDIQS